MKYLKNFNTLLEYEDALILDIPNTSYIIEDKEVKYSEEPKIGSKYIIYKSSDGLKVVPYMTGVFGASLISNDYDDFGLIGFNAPVTKIGEYAFNGCSSLTSVTIPNSVKSIEKIAFSYCRSLTSITIPNSVTSIGDYAFSNCYSLTSIVIPDSVTSIGNDAFKECSSLTSPVYNAHCFAYMPRSYSGAYTIPEGIKQIAGKAFNSCSSLIPITIPNSVTEIGLYAFEGHTGLTSIIIPNSVTSIGKGAFRMCSSLTSITIGESVTSIGNDAFYGCESLNKTNYTGDIAGWCNIKFDNANANPMRQSHNLYINDQEIKDLVIPNTVDTIHNYSFYNCPSLTSIIIGNSVTSIGKYAFSGGSSLTSVTIGNSVTSIGEYAFDGCESLTSVHITDIEAWCKISFGSYNATPLYYAHNLYLNGELVKDVIVPNSVTKIGNHAFRDCKSLTSITIPNSVTSVGESAFGYCSSLTSITIGNRVRSIGLLAFSDCTSLKTITCEATSPPKLGSYNNLSNVKAVYVPADSVDDYKAATNWSYYSSKIKAIQ